MPLSLVTRPLNSIHLVHRFDVIRRQETIGTNGRVIVTSSRFNNISGTVCASGGNDLDRGNDADFSNRGISIVTKFKINNVVKGYKPDLIVWQGGTYLVNHVDNYPHLGIGFYQIEADSIDMVDLNIDFDSLSVSGQLDFQFTNNSNLIGAI